MALLSFFGFGEVLIDIFYSEEGPRHVVVVADCFQPRDLRWKTCSSMEIADCWLDAGHVVDIVDGFLRIWALIHQDTDFVADFISGWDDVHGVETLSFVWAVEQHCLRVLIGDCVS